MAFGSLDLPKSSDAEPTCLFSKFYANEKASPIDGQPAQLERIVAGFGLNNGIEEPYTITKETVYENLMVLQVLFTSIQVSSGDAVIPPLRVKPRLVYFSCLSCQANDILALSQFSDCHHIWS